jgi:hypothetical protein
VELLRDRDEGGDPHSERSSEKRDRGNPEPSAHPGGSERTARQREESDDHDLDDPRGHSRLIVV